MEQQQQQQQIKKYLDLFIRRKNIIISFLLASIIVGLGLYIKTPKAYQANSILIYQRQRINPNPSRMSPDAVQTQTREMVSNVSEQVLSRTNLEELINQFNLYPGMRDHLPIEDVVSVMRDRHIEISQERGDTFKVSYKGADPRKVMLATNALAAKFVEENLRYREERASETSAYVRDELNMAKKSMDKKDTAMRDYKLKYYNEMPEQLQNNITRLNSLQEQYQGIQNSIQDLERTRIMIQEQITLRTDMLTQGISRDGQRTAGSTEDSIGRIPLTGNEPADIARVRAELETLRARYTEQHPEVKRLKKLLVKLEENLSRTVTDPESQENPILLNPQLVQLQRQVKDVEYNISRLKEDKTEVKKQIEQYKKWVAATPLREAEWTALTRDYNQLHEYYERLVTRNLEAGSIESLERRQKGSRFKIIDPAHYPGKPYKPDFKKIMLMAIALGLGLGGGIAFLLEAMNTSFKDAADLESYLDLKVTCSIPMILVAQEKKWAKTKNILWNSSFAIITLMIVASLIYLWRKGIITI